MGRKVTRLARLVRDALMGLAMLLLALLIIVKLDEQALEVLDGPFRAVDGDTLADGSLRLRLEGVDAPELEQICDGPEGPYGCGRLARHALQTMLEEDRWTCEGGERDRYGRLLVRCHLGSLDLAARLVVSGLAVGEGGYLREEREARRQGLGIWQGEFQRPVDWRRQHQLAFGGLEPVRAFGSYLSQMIREWLGSEQSTGDGR